MRIINIKIGDVSHKMDIKKSRRNGEPKHYNAIFARTVFSLSLVLFCFASVSTIYAMIVNRFEVQSAEQITPSTEYTFPIFCISGLLNKETEICQFVNMRSAINDRKCERGGARGVSIARQKSPIWDSSANTFVNMTLTFAVIDDKSINNRAKKNGSIRKWSRSTKNNTNNNLLKLKMYMKQRYTPNGEAQTKSENEVKAENTYWRFAVFNKNIWCVLAGKCYDEV